MKNALVAAIVALLVSASSGFAVTESMEKRTVAQRLTLVEKQLKENKRQDTITQNVLYLKETGILPMFLVQKMRMDGLEYTVDNFIASQMNCFRYITASINGQDQRVLVVNPARPGCKVQPEG
jgi:hypothetical protein